MQHYSSYDNSVYCMICLPVTDLKATYNIYQLPCVLGCLSKPSHFIDLAS